MWQPNEPTTQEDGRLFSFTYMVGALDKVNKSQICAKPKPLKSCLKLLTLNQSLKDALYFQPYVTHFLVRSFHKNTH